MKKRVVVAMSGGVDSSTAAYLLLKQGYEVIGITLKLFDDNDTLSSGCCGIQGINDARGVCFKLSIPFYALNYVSEFEKSVINYFTKEYKNGRTPNPCIACNEKIKFESLLNKAKDLDADYLATGHYARIGYNSKNKRYILKKGKDRNKDQSYFLFSMPQKALKNTLFPLGDYTKDKVRGIAKKIGIKVYNKPESQEICFIPDDDYKNFLSNKDSGVMEPGPIVDKSGKVLGQHKGIAFYTLGQRKGLRIAYKHPLYVTRIDSAKNTIVIGEKADTLSHALIAKKVNWISENGFDKPIKVKAKIRYNHVASDATVVKAKNNSVKVEFKKPQGAIAPGQAVVFYNRDTVVGGATIHEVIR